MSRLLRVKSSNPSPGCRHLFQGSVTVDGEDVVGKELEGGEGAAVGLDGGEGLETDADHLVEADPGEACDWLI